MTNSQRVNTLVLHYYYVPKSINNPFFNSFFFWELGSKVIIVIIQITTAQGHKDHTDAALGTIETLKDRAREQFDGKTIDVMYYVLVGPEIEMTIDKGHLKLISVQIIPTMLDTGPLKLDDIEEKSRRIPRRLKSP
ncbi:hypothetical protein BDP27DRAFT_1426389 [Rhodocollybia butyracea]|uniref:Uncharacterized protein n=1 Tax=Rhodocollybia butyracea TaxID=206335 RepID=A0A9P5U2W9_9AGAR|nr:hypothetical protein BDP27DRAFT_1426389 [Rhodocollybia butyracea]